MPKTLWTAAPHSRWLDIGISTPGYLDFSEANGYYDALPQEPRVGDLSDSQQALAQRNYDLWRSQHNRRSRAQLNINQTLGDYGSLYVSAYQQQYWGTNGRENNINVGTASASGLLTIRSTIHCQRHLTTARKIG